MKKNINLEIGERVRITRKSRGFSREKLSELLGISALFLGYIECGQRGMSLSTLQNICKILNVSSDYILFGKKEQNSYNNLLDSITELDERYHDLALEYINTLKRTIALIEKNK